MKHHKFVVIISPHAASRPYALEFKLNQTLKPGKPGRPRKKTGECA